MGIDADIFDCARAQERAPDHDLVYCGSLERPGLTDALGRMGRKGFSILCVGRIPADFPAAELERSGVRFAGAQARSDIPEYFASARAGLNWVPDIFPLNQQESTKMIEYAAAGLPVVSNRYPWSEAFAAQQGSGVAWLDRIESPDDLDPLTRPTIDLRPREWFAMLDRLGFDRFVGKVAAR